MGNNKTCPVLPYSQRVGGTFLELGSVQLKTWNPSTKQFETLERVRMIQGPTGEKRFFGKPWMLPG